MAGRRRLSGQLSYVNRDLEVVFSDIPEKPGCAYQTVKQ